LKFKIRVPVHEPVFFSGTPENSNWKTPSNILKEIYEWYGDSNNEMFDPCPTNPKVDGLKIDWKERNYINPPYSRGELIKWLEKGYNEFKNGKLCVFLIPSDTSTKYWHEYVMKSSYVFFIKPRVIFVGATGSPKFGSVLVVFDPSSENKHTRFYSHEFKELK
jgi:site-specific DNA-methyltransferase (adenine-specific)